MNIMRVGPTFLWEVSLSSTIEFRRIKIYEKLGDFFEVRIIEKVRMRNEKKYQDPKYLENNAWSNQMELFITFLVFISIDCHQIYEVQRFKEVWSWFEEWYLKRKFLQKPYLGKYLLDIHGSWMIDLGRISSFTWQKILKKLFGFWRILWWRKIWTQALKNHFPKDIDGTALWDGSLIILHLPLSFHIGVRESEILRFFSYDGSYRAFLSQ